MVQNFAPQSAFPSLKPKWWFPRNGLFVNKPWGCCWLSRAFVWQSCFWSSSERPKAQLERHNSEIVIFVKIFSFYFTHGDKTTQMCLQKYFLQGIFLWMLGSFEKKIVLLFQKLLFIRSCCCWYWCLSCIIYFYFYSLLFRLSVIYVYWHIKTYITLKSLKQYDKIKENFAKRKITSDPIAITQPSSFFPKFFLADKLDIYIVTIIAGMQHYIRPLVFYLVITCISHVSCNYCCSFYTIFLWMFLWMGVL